MPYEFISTDPTDMIHRSEETLKRSYELIERTKELLRRSRVLLGLPEDESE
jgi:hypothetical protein